MNFDFSTIGSMMGSSGRQSDGGNAWEKVTESQKDSFTKYIDATKKAQPVTVSSVNESTDQTFSLPEIGTPSIRSYIETARQQDSLRKQTQYGQQSSGTQTF